MRKEEFTVPSSDGKSSLHALRWVPDGEVRMILQISHGMVEYVDRYDWFASKCAAQGILVVGHDHLGHGKTAVLKEDLGYFADENGAALVLKDLHRTFIHMKGQYPNVPYVLMGHSMGSFFARRYLTLYGKELDGAIIMGTGSQPLAAVVFGRWLSGIMMKVKGARYRSRLLFNLTLGSNNKRIKPLVTANDWLTRDPQIVAKYNADPFCTFIFTVSAYHDFFTLLTDVMKKKDLDKIPAELPVLFISGAEDPVGGYAKGVEAACRQYKEAGIKDVEFKLYEGARHEILNETNREEVCDDILCWLDKIPSKCNSSDGSSS
ncbi:alpha/beta fold hydrolase [Lachnotalea sp. AF33-28]|uniref:alpha/beta fold hydrolase n=1 Tax=Lachnotalea sp. AF33-28 TaxID=2292046 RepID=UPI000E468860|nr:alpha/beta hydrolase [Lachnotalea sp. AF33-28]RHP34405.1 alpha/beta fold hydrolase [Lachnotalea sp. AF33-28]